MVRSITRENFIWHKLHSLTGVVPVGFYLCQHLLLNSFALVSPQAYNGVSSFFYSMPPALLWAIELGVVIIPLVFHSVYGLFITNRAKANYIGTTYSWAENRMYWLQRVSGIFLFLFIFFHVLSTTGQVKYFNDHEVVDYAHMQRQFSLFGGLVLVFYALGVLAAAYHFAYGLWNFCIRWGITVSQESQNRMRRFSMLVFVGLTLLGWAALAGFKRHSVEPTERLASASELSLSLLPKPGVREP